jgi:polysaccharide deacetylase 2 family uncharacterized protein YibQ
MASITSNPAFRPLGLATSATVCFLAAGALTITLLGSARHSGAGLDLAPVAAPAPAFPVHPPVSQPSAPVSDRIDKPVYAGHALLADPALIESSPQGPLPRIADDGRKPMTAYAAPAAAGKLRIAILVSGFGGSATAAASALARLPAPITLGFTPYGADVQSLVARAREAGHEVVLEVPMEPFDYPDSDPGPNTLRAETDEESNGQKLYWALSRFTGYAGVTNLLGQRFLADETALAPVMTQFARRGLYFYDKDGAPGSLSASIAGRTGAPFAAASTTLDAAPSAAEIDKQLSALEDAARAHGSAVGTAFLYPVSIDRITLWSKGLSGRGFVLVPISAIVGAPK